MVENNRRRKALKSIIDSGRHYTKADKKTTAIELSSEAIIGLFAIIAAVEAGKIQLVSVEATPLFKYADNPQLLQTSLFELNRSSQGLQDLYNSLRELDAEWRNNYRKSRTVLKSETVTNCDTDGVCTTRTEFHTETEYYWDEPDEWTSKGLNHNVIGHWLNAISTQLTQVNRVVIELPSTPTFVDGFDTYRITETPVNKTKRNFVTTFGFGLAAGGFAFYEEIIAIIAHYSDFDYNSLLANIANQKINRRSFAKLIFGSAAIHQIQKWNLAYAQKNLGAKEEIKTEIKQTIKNMDLDSEEATETLFNKSSHDILVTHNNTQSVLAHSLDTTGTGVEKYHVIRPLLEKVLTQNSSRLDIFAQYIQNDTEAAAFQILKAIASHFKADQHVRKITSEQKSQTFWNAILQVVILFGMFAGVAISTEGALAITDTAYEKFRYHIS